MCLTLLVALGIFSSPNIGSAFRILCDGFFTTGVLLVGFGVLAAIHRTGFFSIFGYAKDCITSVFLPGKGKRARDFYEYKKSQKFEASRARGKWRIVIVGAVFLAVSMVFLALETWV